MGEIWFPAVRGILPLQEKKGKGSDTEMKKSGFQLSLGAGTLTLQEEKGSDIE